MSCIHQGQAASMWCPFARTVALTYNSHGEQTGALSTNRAYDGQPDRGAMCIGQWCMAWRWADAESGYCGLAGRPIDPPKE